MAVFFAPFQMTKNCASHFGFWVSAYYQLAHRSFVPFLPIFIRGWTMPHKCCVKWCFFLLSLSFCLWCHHRKREKQKFTIKNWNYKLLPHRVEVSFYPHSISSSSSSFLCICVLVCVGETNHQRIFKQNV